MFAATRLAMMGATLLDAEQSAEYLACNGTPLCGCLTSRGNQCNEAIGPPTPSAWLHLHRKLACHYHQIRFSGPSSLQGPPRW
jgi:hypothetical protein